jgi:hypothetical protein
MARDTLPEITAQTNAPQARANSRVNAMKPRISALVAIVAFALAGVLGNAPAQAQFAQQGPKLVGTSAGEQGYSVSLSGDGNTGVVGRLLVSPIAPPPRGCTPAQAGCGASNKK